MAGQAVVKVQINKICTFSSTLRSLVLCVSLLLSACVTEVVNSPYGGKADKEEAAEAYVNLALAYIRERNTDQAKRALSRALEIDKKSAAAHNAFALVYQIDGDYKLAEKHYENAVRYDGDYTRARNNYAAFLFGQERYKEAGKQLKVVVEDTMYPRRSAAFESLGVIYLKLEDKAEAEKSFKRAVQLNNNQARSLAELAQLYYDQKNYSQAGGYFDLYRDVARQAPDQIWTAKSLYLGIQLETLFEDSDAVASYGLLLKHRFPYSTEYQMYKEALSHGS